MADPSFYCENCGRKVSSNLVVCPGCGLEFDSVLCPFCGFKGKAVRFQEKCPQCGYGELDAQNIHLKPNLTGVILNRKRKQLPLSLYKVFIGIMVVVIVCLIRILFFL